MQSADKPDVGSWLVAAQLRHFREIITSRPVLVRGPLPQVDPTEPEEPVAVTVQLEWTDGYTEAGQGWAKAWTDTAVLVDVQTSRGHYYSFVHPAQVTRRVPHCE